MSVVIPQCVLKSEFGRDSLSDHEKAVILRTARKELALAIKGEGLPAGTTLLKEYATSDSGAKRLVFLLRNDSGHFVLLFYRDKNDPVGQNITLKNPRFKSALKTQLLKTLADISAGRFLAL